MARIRVITDSACDLPESEAHRLGIDIVSLTIRFGNEEFVDRVNLSPATFWAKWPDAHAPGARPLPPSPNGSRSTCRCGASP